MTCPIIHPLGFNLDYCPSSTISGARNRHQQMFNCFVHKSFRRTKAGLCIGAAKLRVAGRARIIITATLQARMLTPKVTVMEGIR